MNTYPALPPITDQRHELAALRSVLADREAELLEVKGPCSNGACSLHHTHRGPCKISLETR